MNILGILNQLKGTENNTSGLGLGAASDSVARIQDRTYAPSVSGGNGTPASYVSNLSGELDGLKSSLNSSAKSLNSVASGLTGNGAAFSEGIMGSQAGIANLGRRRTDDLSRPIEFAKGGPVTDIYKRPLFMQQGGMARVPMPTPPAAMRPSTAPQGAMPPMRPAAAPMAPAARPTDQASGIASMVSDKAKADLAQAQGPEQIINAFRGNQKPLEARYEELAQYVGPQDATSTPISVLTMVQPALMMTAKGAADSGIGELMANVAGNVNMESAPGQANRMGQGLGNIMMSRQAPQPAGMAQGGVVGKFDKGGIVEYYKQDLPAFQEILAPSQQDKDAAKRQLFFDIAQRGLAMAGGAGGTGNVASQLANVFQTLPGTYAAQQAELRKGERAAQQAALQSAAGRVGEDREQQAKAAESAAEASRRQGEAYQKFIYDMTLANNKAMLEAKNKGEEFEGVSVVDPKGTQLGVLNTLSPTFESDLAEIKTNNPGAQVVKIPDLKDLFPAADVPELTPSAVEGVFADNTLLEALNSGDITGPQLTRINAAIAKKTQPTRTTTGRILEDGMPEVVITQESLPEQWLPVIRDARQRGIQVQMPLGVEDSSMPLGSQTPQGDSPLTAEYEQQVQSSQPLSLDQIKNVALPNLDEEIIGSEDAVLGYPIQNLFGTWASLDRTFNTYAPALLGLIGPEAALAAAPEQAEADAEAALEAFKVLVVESMMAARGDKASNQLRDQLGSLFPDINSAFTNSVDAAGKYKKVRNEMLKDVRMVQDQLKNPLTAAAKTNYQFILRELSDRLQELDTIVRQLEGSTPGGEGTPAATFDQIFEQSTRVPYASQ
jgi:hypothetical protein